VSLSLFFGVLTLTSAVMALIIVGLGYAQRARAPLALGLAAIGTVVPAIALLVLTPDLSLGVPYHVALWPGSDIQRSWFAPILRADNFGHYAALGLAFIIAPLLLWIGWHTTRQGPAQAAIGASDRTSGHESAADASGAASEPPEAISDASSELAGQADQAGDADAMDAADDDTAAYEDSDVDAIDDAEQAPSVAPRAELLRPEQWAGLALALGIESAGLLLCFADGIIWFAVCWIVLALLVWGLGELGSESAMLDRRGLGVMLAGPVLWLVAILLVAGPAAAPRFYDLMGRGGTSAIKVVLLALTLALAGGAYPFLVWVRRRAAFTTPAGLGAIVLALMPAAVIAGARTYSALQDTSSLWPQLGTVTPPITAGIVFSILGALTIGVCGLLALGRGDGRSLLALLASAQVGWALFALGTGEPASAVGLVVLLATMVFGLAAMIASLVAGGVVTTDIEPAGAGPRPFGAPLRGIHLFAWSGGAAALVGAPLLAGFIPRQIITASALNSTKIAIPLLGLAWAGDALLAFALIRATAPALLAKPAEAALIGKGESEEAAVEVGAQPTAKAEEAPAATGEDEAEEIEETEEIEEPAESARRPGPFANLEFGEALGAICAALALVIGAVPQWLLAAGCVAAAGDLVQPGAAATSIALHAMGYSVGLSQWLPTIAWLAILLLAAVFLGLRYGMARVVAPANLAGQPTLAAAEVEEETEESGLSAPTDLWKDLSPAFRSNWTLPGTDWLLSGVEDDSEAEVLPADESEEAEEDELSGEGEEEATVLRDEASEKTKSATPADGAASATGRRSKAERGPNTTDVNDAGGEA
jgi:formate hydrogenlyase subunit 3/multisubunit Na+/H+ antiporter MnhD subunit